MNIILSVCVERTRKDYASHSLLCHRDSMPVRICGLSSIGSCKKFKLSHHHDTRVGLQHACALHQWVVIVWVILLWPSAAPSPIQSWSCEIGRNGNLQRKLVGCPNLWFPLMVYQTIEKQIWFGMDLEWSSENSARNQPVHQSYRSRRGLLRVALPSDSGRGKWRWSRSLGSLGSLAGQRLCHAMVGMRFLMLGMWFFGHGQIDEVKFVQW